MNPTPVKQLAPHVTVKTTSNLKQTDTVASAAKPATSGSRLRSKRARTRRRLKWEEKQAGWRARDVAAKARSAERNIGTPTLARVGPTVPPKPSQAIRRQEQPRAARGRRKPRVTATTRPAARVALQAPLPPSAGDVKSPTPVDPTATDDFNVKFPLDMNRIAACSRAVEVGEMSDAEGAVLLKSLLSPQPELVTATIALRDAVKAELSSPVSWATGLRLSGKVPVQTMPISMARLAQVFEAPTVQFRNTGAPSSTVTAVLAGLTAVVASEVEGAVLIGVGTSTTWGLSHVQRPIGGSWDIDAPHCTSCECKGVCRHVLELADSRVSTIFVLGPGFDGSASKYTKNYPVCMLAVSGPLVRTTNTQIAIGDEAAQPYKRNRWWDGRSGIMRVKLSGKTFGSGHVYQTVGGGAGVSLAPGSVISRFLWPEELLLPRGVVACANSVDVCLTLADRVAATSIGRASGVLTTNLAKRTAVRLVESGDYPLYASEGETTRAAILLADRYNSLYPYVNAPFRTVNTLISLFSNYSLYTLGLLIAAFLIRRLSVPITKKLEAAANFIGNLLAFVVNGYRKTQDATNRVAAASAKIARSIGLEHAAPGSVWEKARVALEPSMPLPTRLFWVACEEAYKRAMPLAMGPISLTAFEFAGWVSITSFSEALRIYGPTCIFHFVWWSMHPVSGFLFHAAWNEWIYATVKRYPGSLRP